jgi:aminoglycoside phosphotransferase family enzyme/predicted kinase
MELSQLIEALSDPTAYPYPVKAVEVRQTHISAVFLAGPYAYKVKKPVNPGFLDFSTLEKRRHFCDEEVRLNRRLAPQVYLGVVSVVTATTGAQFEGEGKVVEWAVKMRRLPDDATLQERLRRGAVGPDLAEALGERVASFHRRAETGERIASFGRFEVVARVIRDIFDQAAPRVGATVSPSVFARARALTDESLSRLRPLVESRAARGMTRDCHGDLHLDHVYFFPEQEPPDDLVIIDCIEFNERFRFIDPVADMAFPAMDLAFNGRRDLGRAFADAYFRASGDEEGRALLPLYTAYRAAVRGTVEGLLLAEEEVPAPERAAALQRARAHWLLALTELEAPRRKPCLLLVAGLPGTGKSSLARGLAAQAGFRVIRSDVVRKELAGLTGEGPTPAHLRESLYTPEWTKRTYDECMRRADQLLFEGARVLVDANFREESKRQAFLGAALRWGVPGGMLLCQAEPDTVRGRLERRWGDASDADWAIYRHLSTLWEAVGSSTRLATHLIGTDGPPEQVAARALGLIQQMGLWGQT